MNTGPIVAISLSLILTICIYISSVRTKISSQSVMVTNVAEKIQNAFSNIENSDSPEAQMKGILQMRSLSQEYPENIDLQWSMGIFSMQSGQFKKAVERFKNVLNIDSNRQDANIQLAICYKNLHDTINARLVLEALIVESEGDLKSKAQSMFDKLK
jgi:Flp pilus assembly protein TadD